MYSINKLIMLLVLSVIAFAQLFSQEKSWSTVVQSPDKKLALKFSINEQDELQYSITADGKLMLQPSLVGPETEGKLVLAGSKTSTINTVWKPVWGKRSLVADSYNEIVLAFNLFTVNARIYNDGIAFKYENSEAQKERTQFHFAGNFTAWYYKIEDHNIGPELLNDAEGDRLPVMTIKAGPESYMAVHEAALESGEPLVLRVKKGTSLFTVASQRAKAWRVIMYGRSPGDLVDSHLIELLNPDPADHGDFSWVVTGVAVWDWRINGAVAGDFKYEMSLPSWKRMVDFASANGLKALVLDADWYGPEFSKDSDPLKGDKVEQVHQIIAYGKQKGVGVWLYLNDVAGRTFPLDKILKQYNEWGAAGIKYGFMRGTQEEKNTQTQLITKLCAQNHLLVDYHDNPVHPFGQMRTWPNAVTREYCHSQLDAHRVFQPATFVTAVFVNMVAGPIDMCNGVFDMMQSGRVDNSTPVPSTITAEAARTLITFSGVTIIPDIPENYNRHPQILKFISAQKMPWQESRTLSGEIGEHIVMARKAADGNWLVGAATNEKARTLKIPLSFLDDAKYEALVIQDGRDADFRTRKESYRTSVMTVKRGQFIEVRIAPGGGACVLLEKKK